MSTTPADFFPFTCEALLFSQLLQATMWQKEQKQELRRWGAFGQNPAELFAVGSFGEQGDHGLRSHLRALPRPPRHVHLSTSIDGTGKTKQDLNN